MFDHGHWDLEVSDGDTLVPDAFAEERVNMGIAIVVPVYRILEVINQEIFVSAREQLIIELKEKTIQGTDKADGDSTSEPNN